MVIVLQTIVGPAVVVDDAVTVTSGATSGEVAEGCCCELGDAVVTAEEAVAEAVLSCVLLMVTEIQWKFMRCTATELILVVMPILTSAAILGALLCRAR